MDRFWWMDVCGQASVDGCLWTNIDGRTYVDRRWWTEGARLTEPN
jgi:hypothetical protein